MTQITETTQNDDQPVQHTPASERIPGQGNSSDGLTRRLGADVATRGEKEVEQIKKGEGNGEEQRVREGSQGGSKGQKS